MRLVLLSIAPFHVVDKLHNILTTSEAKCHRIIRNIVNRQMTAEAWESTLHSLAAQGIDIVQLILWQTLVIVDGKNALNGIRIQLFILEKEYISLSRSLICISSQVCKERYSLTGKLYAFCILHLPIMIGHRSISASKIHTNSNIIQCTIHIKHILWQDVIRI